MIEPSLGIKPKLLLWFAAQLESAPNALEPLVVDVEEIALHQNGDMTNYGFSAIIGAPLGIEEYRSGPVRQ